MDEFREKFKKALEFLESSDISSPNKPVIPHVTRVGRLLYKKGFADEVVEAGILHDILEWSSVTEYELRKKFGDIVADIVTANTKDRSITDKLERRNNQIKKCLEIGYDALAIKIADNLDSFDYYSKLKNEKNLQRCRDCAEILLQNLSKNLIDKFLNDLNQIK